jgi:hypothetical protein
MYKCWGKKDMISLIVGIKNNESESSSQKLGDRQNRAIMIKKKTPQNLN